jgi:hypothetical protein
MLTRWLAVAVMTAFPAIAHAQTVHLRYDTSLPQAVYAAGRLQVALTERGYTLGNGEANAHEYRIDLRLDARTLEKEAFEILPAARVITVSGGDAASLVYGSLALVEALRNGTSLGDILTAREAPRFPFRGIKHNLPWDTYAPAWRSTSTTRPRERSSTGRRSST